MHHTAAVVAVALSCFLPGTIAVARADDAAALRLVLCGDSTMCEYPPEKPDRGWGQYLQGYSVRMEGWSGSCSPTPKRRGGWRRTMQVPLIDVQSSSRALVESLGPEGSAAMANAPGDRTHFNEQGATAMAELVMKELPTAAPQLQKHLSQRERASELCGAFRQGAITAGPAEVSLRDDFARRAFPQHTSWTCEILQARRASADPGLSFFLLHQVVAATQPDPLSPFTAAAAPRPPSHP